MNHMTPGILAGALMLVVTTAASAQSYSYGDWTVTSNSAATVASTINQSGSTFGFICVISIDQCVYYVSAHTTCDQKGSSAILINTEAGTLPSSISCAKFGNTYYNSIQSTSDLGDLVKQSTTIGIAMPMANGEFKVVRFSLIGAEKAIYEAAVQAAAMEKSTDHMQ